MNKAIIIGASSGIGRELAKIFDANQFKVGIVGRRLNLLKELQANLQNESYIKQIDVSNIDTAREKLNELIVQMEGIDVVVISAGIGHRNPMHILQNVGVLLHGCLRYYQMLYIIEFNLRIPCGLLRGEFI